MGLLGRWGSSAGTCDRGLGTWEDTALLLEGSLFCISKPPTRVAGASLANRAELCHLWKGSQEPLPLRDEFLLDRSSSSLGSSPRTQRGLVNH